MDEQQRAVLVRRRRSWAEAAQLVAEYESSGLSQRQFCESRGLCLATLSRYRQRLRNTGGEASGDRWVAVEVPGPGAGGAYSGLSVVLGRGRKIEVERGFDAAALVELMRVLERF
ncbi:MAG: IS66 family insertion sequence element accessory protein TnpA [Acidobacteriota bacterium]